MTSIVIRQWKGLSAIGLLMAFALFAASLTPSLMPRPSLHQGVLSGLAAAMGYLIGLTLEWIWIYLELPARFLLSQWTKLAIIILGLLGALLSLRQAADWQNSIRNLWQMPPIDSADPYRLAAVALTVFLAAYLLGALFQLTYRMLTRRLRRLVPRRISNVVGLSLAVALFWAFTQGVLLSAALRMADSSFRSVDALIDDDTPEPGDPAKTGSSASLISWQGLGRQGRNYIASGPSASAIGDFWKTPALEPIRVYVGLNNAATPEERAQLALQELFRQRAFDRKSLVIITPTGTGWVDPASVDTLDFLEKGNVATVAVQYSYLASWLSLLVEPEYGSDTARALFQTVYSYWTTLPHDRRPRLYVHGLSLGALNSQNSTDIFDVIADPFQGAFWVGPPFASRTWQTFTAGRVPDSPAWLPQFRDGSLVRFANQFSSAIHAGAAWGPMRIVYLQYASDPVTFFDPHAFYREPDWMRGERGPDVSPQFQWFPALTMLQLLGDVVLHTNGPMGHGHIYAPADYLDGWIAVLGTSITPEQQAALKRYIAAIK